MILRPQRRADILPESLGLARLYLFTKASAESRPRPRRTRSARRAGFQAFSAGASGRDRQELGRGLRDLLGHALLVEAQRSRRRQLLRRGGRELESKVEHGKLLPPFPCVLQQRLLDL